MIAPGWWSDASSGGRHFPQHEAVSVPYWEWEGAKGAGEREVYLRGKLEALGGGDRRDDGGRGFPGPLLVRLQPAGFSGLSDLDAQLNKRIMKCETGGAVCQLIKTHGADFNHVNVASAMCKVLQVSRVGRLEYSAMRKLEAFSLP